MVEGRHVGRWYEWQCATCGCVLQSSETPRAPEDEHCGACRGLTTAQQEIRALRAQVVVLERELARLEKENAEQCDHIYELQQMVARAYAELGRAAPTEPPTRAA